MTLSVGARGGGAFDLPAEEQRALREAEQGSLFRLPEIPAISISRSILPGPRLLFSDMPEYVGASNGVTMEETLTPGEYRLYIYHVPGTVDSPRSITAVIENLSDRKLGVKFRHYGFPAPGSDYPKMGLDGLMEFFTSKKLPPTVSVAPHQRAVLDKKLDETVASDPELVHAFYEFSIDEPTRISVIQKDPWADAITILDTLPRLPQQLPGRRLSGAGRGIYEDADLLVANAPGTVIDTANGIQRLVLADGLADPWVAGTDGLTPGTTVTNKGSYGVVYQARLSYVSGDGRAIALLVGGSGRSGGRPAAVLRVSDGKWKGGWVRVAGERRRGGMMLVQSWRAAPPGRTNVIEAIYSPPGGSSLPTPMYFVPFKP